MRRNLCGIVLAALLAGRGAGAAEIVVSAAASLTDALRELGTSFEKAHPDTKVTFNFAASGVLRAQIEQGAPADVFVSADLVEMDKLQQAGRVVEAKPLAKGELVLAVPASDTKTQTLEDLKKPELKRIGLGSPETVPAGRYAVQSLERLGLWNELEPKAVYAENVRQVLQYLETGATEAGFVYRTDALKGKGVRVVVAVPEASHEPIVYPIAVVRSTSQEKLAQEFVDFLLSAAGQEILSRYGFRPPAPQ
jgi:molybdate transport system substrate-binding protein